MGILSIFKKKRSQPQKQLFTKEEYSDFLYESALLYDKEIDRLFVDMNDPELAEIISRASATNWSLWNTFFLVQYISNTVISRLYPEHDADDLIKEISIRVAYSVASDDTARKYYSMLRDIAITNYSSMKFISPQDVLSWDDGQNIVGEFIISKYNLTKNRTQDILVSMSIMPGLISCATMLMGLYDVLESTRIE